MIILITYVKTIILTQSFILFNVSNSSNKNSLRLLDWPKSYDRANIKHKNSVYVITKLVCFMVFELFWLGAQISRQFQYSTDFSFEYDIFLVNCLFSPNFRKLPL